MSAMDHRDAEYVLGTLDRAERAAFAEELARSPDAQDAVAYWERRLAPLADAGAPVSPPAHVWTAIERALGAGALGFREAEDGSARRMARALHLWRTAALSTAALAAALLVYVGWRAVAPTPPADAYIAAVEAGGGRPALLVHVDMTTHTVLVRPVAAEAPAGKSLELWFVDDGGAPHSMGVIGETARSMPMPDGARIHNASFAVSLEPPGGSQKGGPSGPVLYKGIPIKE